MGQENIVEVKNQDQSDKAKNGNDFNAYVQECLDNLSYSNLFLLNREFKLTSDFSKNIFVKGTKTLRMDNSFIWVDDNRKELLICHIDNTTTIRDDRFRAKAHEAFTVHKYFSTMVKYMLEHYPEYSSYKMYMCIGLLFPNMDDEKEKGYCNKAIREFRDNIGFVRCDEDLDICFLDFCMYIDEFLYLLDYLYKNRSSISLSQDIFYKLHKELFNSDDYLSILSLVRDNLKQNYRRVLDCVTNKCYMYTIEELQECAYVLGWGRKSIPKSRSGVRKKIIDWINQLIALDETF